MTKLLCGYCRQACDAKVIDTGIGGYEFWGQKCHDSRTDIVSSCCEDDLLNDEGRMLDDGERYDLLSPPEREWEPEYD